MPVKTFAVPDSASVSSLGPQASSGGTGETERARGDRPGRRARTADTRRGSPILRITALVGIVALALIGSLVVLQGSGPGNVDAAGLDHPAAVTPVELGSYMTGAREAQGAA